MVKTTPSLPARPPSGVELAIGYTFRDEALLRQSLMHSSAAPARTASNERLEFLGDCILGVVACELIYERYPGLAEGDMTKIKSTVVSRQTCVGIAAALGLDRAVQVGKGFQGLGQLPQSIVAGVVEAVIAAVYIDACENGLAEARKLLLPLLRPLVERAHRSGHQENFKSVLQQHAQNRLGIQPQYLVLDEKGPDHAKCFEVCVEIGARRFESAWGQSKKQAEQAAALNALVSLGLTDQRHDGELVVIRDDEVLEPFKDDA